MSSNSEYIIPFEGLNIGKHSFEFEMTTKFFEELTYSIIQGGEIKVLFELDKKERMMIGQFDMEGIVQKTCDRCNDLMEVPVKVEHQIVFKFGNGESDDENLIMVPDSSFTIDISSIIYELLTVALPSRTVHEEDECNEEMLDFLNQYVDYDEQDESNEDEDDIDPRWAGLKKLK